jgi:RNA-directed DNA polymerase
VKRLPPATHALAQAIAMAVLADAQSGPGRRTLPALVARVSACLGSPVAAGEPAPLPEHLFEQLRRLSAIDPLEWPRLEPEDVATWLARGVWWRKAGVRAHVSELQHLPSEGADPQARGAQDLPFDGQPVDGADDAEEERPAPPIHTWRTSQLAAEFQRWASRRGDAKPLHWLLRAATPGPAPAWSARGKPLSVLATAADVVHALAVSLEDVLWLAPENAQWREPQDGGQAMPPSHYRCRLLPKPSGGLRLLEAPRPRLASVQRRILDTLLREVPVHEAAHGFVRGRSVGSHAAVHTQQAVVIRFDLADFFTSLHATRVRALWKALGHSRTAAELLTRLTTVRTPRAVRNRLQEDAVAAHTPPTEAVARRRAIDARLARAHLPQGAPTSPALANLCAFGLDVRLQALAQRFGARYTRYADDLVFSGPARLRGRFRELHAWVEAIARDEGFALRADKTRMMPAHQRQFVTGLVVNQRPNYSRAQYELLKARLHRLAQQPQVPGTERAPLAGEIEWARQWLAPSRSAKLQRLFDAIPFAHGD